MTVMSDLIERACEVMHDAYEAAAVREGWETQAASRKPWSDVPEANKATMRAAMAALLDSPLIAGWLAEAKAEARAEALRPLLEAYPTGCDGLGCSGWDDLLPETSGGEL